MEQNQPNPTQSGELSQSENRAEQQQTDPQMTELKGFTDASEDLEPTLADGGKAPDNAEAERNSDSETR